MGGKGRIKARYTEVEDWKEEGKGKEERWGGNVRIKERDDWKEEGKKEE